MSIGMASVRSRTAHARTDSFPCRSNPQAMCDPSDQITQLVPVPQGQQVQTQGGFNNNLGAPNLNPLGTFGGAGRGLGGRGILNPRGQKPGTLEGE